MCGEQQAEDKTMSGRKRFIAGAVCPSCGVEDLIFVQLRDGEPTRNCSCCDFSESLPDEVEQEVPATPWQPIKLVNPGE